MENFFEVSEWEGAGRGQRLNRPILVITYCSELFELHTLRLGTGKRERAESTYGRAFTRGRQEAKRFVQISDFR